MNAYALGTIFALVAGAAVFGGLFLLALGMMRRPAKPPRGRHDSRLARWWVAQSPQRRLLIVGSFLVGLLVAMVFGWMIAPIVLPAIVVFLPAIMMRSDEDVRIAKMNAMAEWTRSLSSVLMAGQSLPQAVAASQRSVPPAIKTEVTHLVGFLSRSNITPEVAFRAFAEEMRDYTGDEVAAALIVSSRVQGSGLSATLKQISVLVAQDVRNRLAIEAERESARTEARMIVAISVAGVGITVLSGMIFEYSSPFGQALLLFYLGLFGLFVYLVRRIAAMPDAPRVLGEQARLRK
ncbi:MAG: type II secretion system F family protein [Propionibacteriaceae bacterium]|nr:type II secretion system F family protein [Propionibacteriaceae bacterium]